MHNGDFVNNIFSAIYDLRKERKYEEAIKYLLNVLKNKNNLSKETIYWCYERLDFFYKKTNQIEREIELLENFLENYHDECLYHHLLESRYERLLQNTEK